MRPGRRCEFFVAQSATREELNSCQPMMRVAPFTDTLRVEGLSE
jgi:hypothetical protein